VKPKRILSRSWKNVLLFLAVVGPGFITANVDNDAGGIFVYSQAGAQFGYTLLWTMIPITISLIVIQEMCARMGAATGKGLSDLIREEYGIRATFLMMLALLVVNFGNVISEFLGIASSLELFGISRYISVPLCALLVWFMVVKGTYTTVEKVFLGASFFYVSYIIAGVLAGPNWGEALASTVRPPHLADLRNPGYVVMIISLIGTTIAPWMQFYLQASIAEKGVTIRQYALSRLDVIVGCFITDIVAWFIIVGCAAALYTVGHTEIHNAADAAQALKPLAGKYASILFAAGLFNASLFAASILPISTAYTVCEGLGFESGVDKRFGEAPVFYWLYTILLAAGAGFVLIPGLPLVKVIILSQYVNGIALPPVLIFMLLLINKKELMGAHTNSRLFNTIAWATAIIVIGLTMVSPFTQ
jgi:Mn2+/Fe2+ NRAMP family transporter